MSRDHEAWQRLLAACAESESAAVAAVAREPALLQAFGPDSRPLICYAVEWAEDETVARLLAVGVDPDPVPEDYVPLAWACWLGRPRVVRALLDAGASATRDDGCHGPPLAACTYHEVRLACLRELCERHAEELATDPASVYAVGPNVIHAERLDVLRLLLERGALDARILGESFIWDFLPSDRETVAKVVELLVEFGFGPGAMFRAHGHSSGVERVEDWLDGTIDRIPPHLRDR